MLKAYFDASARPSGIFCVAGYAFRKSEVKKFDKHWSRIFGKFGGCHMKELAHCAGRFKGVDRAVTSELQKKAVKVIKDRMSYGIVISCDLNEISELLPTWIDGFQHAYPVCCHAAMIGLGLKLDEAGISDNVAYFFESGDDYSEVAHRFMGRTDDTPELKAAYRHGSHTFIGKEGALPLQAADMLAWEWTKFMDETITAKMRPMRQSIIALMGNNGEIDPRYKGTHLTGASLRSFAEKVSRVGLMQIAQDVFAKPKKGRKG